MSVRIGDWRKLNLSGLEFEIIGEDRIQDWMILIRHHESDGSQGTCDRQMILDQSVLIRRPSLRAGDRRQWLDESATDKGFSQFLIEEVYDSASLLRILDSNGLKSIRCSTYVAQRSNPIE